MKFVIAVVIVALAACAQASVYAPLAYSYAPAPLVARPIGSYADQRQYVAHELVAPLTYSAPLTYGDYYGAHLAYAAPPPVDYAAPAIIARETEPTYTAVNRGAVHVAPLPGHSESTSAVNLEAAPGTL